jgi:addiction module HigA family antidote
MARPKEANAHPGAYIRDEILPKGMSVTAAAKVLDVGRPALSNLLNGNAALSPEMAARIERAFGADARGLLDMQAAYDAVTAKAKGVGATAKTYVPPFMQFKANDIQSWASSIKSRTRLAVFLRTLVNSTGIQLTKVDFPGNDDAERPGWDGSIEAGEAMPWIPAGKSGWEFGTNNDPKAKADHDFSKSVDAIPSKAERREMAFVFVTPMRWHGKAAWQQERRNEKQWRDVLVFDASDLEQWLEQSIPAQVWLAGELGVSSEGVAALDDSWKQWQADCEPQLSEMLFNTQVELARSVAIKKFAKPGSDPLIVAADSNEEALAFLHCLFNPEDADLGKYRDRVAVFHEQGALTKLAAKPSDFIAVLASREVEKELAPLKANLRSIVIYPRNATNADADITLEQLGYDAFDKALTAMGCKRDDISRLAQESGRSLTVLRRRMAKLEAIRTPGWASDAKVAASMTPFIFAGSWKAHNEADKTVLSLLAGDVAYDELENVMAGLIVLPESPVWAVSQARGLVSKIDALYAVNRRLTWADIERFLNIAKLVLAEDDPSLDLPEEDRWAAGMYGKTREVSNTLREGVRETLVLLAVHGNTLFQKRLGRDLEFEVGRLVESLLTPLTTRMLEAQADDLPAYAEAAPEVFLHILEEDLLSADPQTLGLLRPASTGTFGRNPRTGLLWALENIAWTSDYLMRVAKMLAQLAQTELNDNLVNKPISSLSAIFRCWMPQTTAPVEKRIAALEYLVRLYPKIAWPICVAQFDGRQSIGMYSYKPRWRTDAHGAGEVVTHGEASKFALRALALAVEWNSHDSKTLGDLVGAIDQLPDEFQELIWSKIKKWNETANEEERAILREKIRVNTFSRRAVKRKKEGQLGYLGREAYQILEPKNLILKHEWLFRKQWVEESLGEMQSGDYDFKKRDQRIEALRLAALKEVLSESGPDGILDLAARGESSSLIGWMLQKIVDDPNELVALVGDILGRGSLESSPTHQTVIAGLLQGLLAAQKTELFTQVIESAKAEELVSMLVQAPFNKATWDFVEALDDASQERYWSAVSPWMSHGEGTDHLQYALEKLVAVARPRAAYRYVHFEQAQLPAKALFRLLEAMASGSEEVDGTYQLDRYDLAETFKILTESGEIPVDQMAGMEFQYIEAFTREDSPITNLEKHIEANPELFVQALVFAFKRSDEGEDPEDLRPENDAVRNHRATAGYRLLEKLRTIPGHDENGELDAKLTEAWVTRVRSSAAELARTKVGDSCLGKLFSHAPVGRDGVWPCEPVREVMEKIGTDSFADGFTMGIYNSRGAVWRGEGGDQERELASKYETWATALEFTYPRVSAILRQMVRSYEHDARWQDNNAAVRRRLRD